MSQAVFVAFLGLAFLQSSTEAQPIVTREVFLMGTTAAFHVRSPNRDSAIDQIESAVAILESAERELSTWIGDSALSRINRAHLDEPVSTGRSICELLETLASWSEETWNAFDPAVGHLIDVWGLRDGGRFASQADVERALEDSGVEHFEVEPSPGGCIVTRRKDVRIDAGAFGKGAGLDRVARRFPGDPPKDSWMIDLGGQIALGGGQAWEVALSHPRRRDLEVARIVMESGSLATSGGSEHDIAVEGRMLGHILDPRTGATVVSEISVVVWHSEALVADILSTALYVMGLREGFEWAENRGIAAAFLIPEEGDTDEVEIRATTPFLREFSQVELGSTEYP